jgi:outer membrane protein
MRQARRQLFGAIAGAAIALAVPAVTPAETLTDTLIAAYRNSNLLDQNRAVLRAADEDVAIAVSSLRPVVNFILQGGYGYNEVTSQDQLIVNEALSGNAQLAVEMLVYDFGRTQLAIEATRETVLATREALIGVEQGVLLAAVAAFVNVRLSEELVRLGENNVRVIGEELRAAQDRFEVGEITRTDVAQAESRLAQSRSNLVAAQGELAIAREAYRAATGAYPGRLTAPPPPPITAASLEAARRVAERTHPTIRQAQRQANAAELNVGRARAGMSPTIGLSATAEQDDAGLNTYTFGLQFNQTVYAGGRLAAVLRQAMAQRDQARAALLQSIVTVSENVGNAWARLDVARVRIEATQQQIDAAQVAFEGVREEATLGARTTLDVLNAEQDLLDARAERLRAEASRYIGVYDLLSAMGLLTVEHLKLGIPVYDPAAYYNAVRNAPAHSPQGRRLDRIMRSIGGE